MNNKLSKTCSEIEEGNKEEQRSLSEVWEEFKRVIMEKQVTDSKEPIESKSFNNKDGTFSLELNCSDCGDKFIQKFNIGNCEKCKKIFDDKVQARIEEMKKKGHNHPEWLNTILASLDVSDPGWNKELKKK